jgi:hypothetical protein
MRTPALAALLLASLPGPGLAAAGAGLPFLRDDYPRALAEARARQVPILVDVWAPW